MANWNHTTSFDEMWEDIQLSYADKMNADGMERFRQFLVESQPKRPADMSLDQFVARVCIHRAHKFYDPTLPANRLEAAEYAIWQEMEPRFDAPDADREALSAELRERALAAIA